MIIVLLEKRKPNHNNNKLYPHQILTPKLFMKNPPLKKKLPMNNTTTADSVLY